MAYGKKLTKKLYNMQEGASPTGSHHQALLIAKQNYSPAIFKENVMHIILRYKAIVPPT